MTKTNRGLLARRILLRLAAGLVLAAGIAGPSPGYTGGCSTGSGGMVADARQFCVDKEGYTCARECPMARGIYTMDYCNTQCTSTAILTRCGGFGWAAGCAPTQAVTGRCIETLRNTALLATPPADLIECQFSTLCSASGLTSSELSSSEPASSEPEGI